MKFSLLFSRLFLIGTALTLSGATFAQQQEELTGEAVRPTPPTVTRPRPALPP